MKTLLYYVGWLVFPVLFLLTLTQESARALKLAFHNTIQLNKGYIASHKRYYGKEITTLL